MQTSRGEGAAQTQKTRKPRSDKRTRVNPGLPADVHEKLELLATSCDMTKTNLAGLILRYALDSREFVLDLQNKYNKNPRYRVTPVLIDNKKIQYMFLDS